MPARCINRKFYAMCVKERDAAGVLDLAPVVFVATAAGITRRGITYYLRNHKSFYIESALAKVFRLTKATFRRSIGLPKRKVDSLGRKYVAKKPRKPVQKRRGRK